MAPKSWSLRLTLSGTVVKHLLCVVAISATGAQTGAVVLGHAILSKRRRGEVASGKFHCQKE